MEGVDMTLSWKLPPLEIETYSTIQESQNARNIKMKHFYLPLLFK